MVHRMGLGVAALLGLGLAVLPACETDTPGVKSNYYSQWTNVNANVEDATDAVEAVLSEDLELIDVKAHSTKVDGEVIGKRADGTKVSVAIRRVDNNTSEVSAYAGKTGDPQLGQNILAHLQDRLDKDGDGMMN